MILSGQQETALKMIREWLADKSKPFFDLGGYAGCGKTTLCGVLNGELGGDVLFAAYTGKAALQLRKKGCEGASTLHKLLYDPKDKSGVRLAELQEAYNRAVDTGAPDSEVRELALQLRDEKKRTSVPHFIRRPREESEITGAKLVIVDEKSMLDQQIYADLMSYGTPVLFVGDPAQLPPVQSESPLTAATEDYVLTEVHRQALDNPILRAATMVRQGDKNLALCDDGERFVWCGSGRLQGDEFLRFDQILCGRNNTRSRVNSFVARKLGYPDQYDFQSGAGIAKGERIIFLRNDHEKGIYNGSIGIVQRSFYSLKDDELIIDAEVDGNDQKGIAVWPGLFCGRDILDAPKRVQIIDRAYGLTCHKAQGSEWDSVLINDESYVFKDDAGKWLYTALTRAKERCVLVRS